MMKRRQVITGLLALTTASLIPRATQNSSNLQGVTGIEGMGGDADQTFIADIDPPFVDPINDREFRVASNPPIVIPKSPEPKEEKAATLDKPETVTTVNATVQKVNKNIDFERDYDDDIFLQHEELGVLHSVSLRLKNLQSTVGYGNFNILNFDDALKLGKRFDAVGQFTPVELDFIERIFFPQCRRIWIFRRKSPFFINFTH